MNKKRWSLKQNKRVGKKGGRYIKYKTDRQAGRRVLIFDKLEDKEVEEEELEEKAGHDDDTEEPGRYIEEEEE